MDNGPHVGESFVAACVFCGGLLAPPEPGRLYGFTGQIAGAYATLERDEGSGSRRDSFSNVTGKFPLLALGWSKPAEAGLGAGTPVTEVRFAIAFGTSHDEAEEPEGTPGRVLATGTGRYENLAIALRGAVSRAVSLEGFFVQRRHKVTDLVNSGKENLLFTEERLLTADREDAALGARFRWRDLEAALHARYTVAQGQMNTSRAGLFSRGGLPGAGGEVVWRSGSWMVTAVGGWSGGTVPRDDMYFPDFVVQSARPSASLWETGIGTGATFGRVALSLLLSYGESRLPWVSLAVLGSENRLVDSGYRPSSAASSGALSLAASVLVARGIRVKAFGGLTSTRETVTWEDAVSSRPPAVLDVSAPAVRQFAFGLGMDFVLGGGS